MAEKKWYTLDEAAAKLGISPDEVNKLAQRNELRRTQAGQTWQYRAQDVDELARTSLTEELTHLGGSDNPLGAGGGENDIVFDFQQPGSGRLKRDNPPSSGRLPKVNPDANPQPPALDELGMLSELGGQDPTSGSKSKFKRKTGLEPVARTDSSVKLVPMPTDSSGDLPLSLAPGKPAGRPELPETVSLPPLDLDDLVLEEPGSGKHSPPKSASRLQSPGQQSRPPADQLDFEDLTDLQAPLSGSSSKPKPKTKVQAPRHTTSESPFELSEQDLTGSELGGPPPSSRSLGSKSKSKLQKPAFEISEDDEVDLGGMPAGGLGAASGSSGINLQSPADSGISLEKADHGAEFELSLDDHGDATEGSSEFELSLDESSLAPLEEPKASQEPEKDIFETDFEMPALDEESGFEPVALQESDTDVGSSDFDLSLSSDDDSADLDDSGSHVVALGEEEDQADEAAKTIVRRRKSKIHLEEEQDDVSGSLEDDASFEGLDADTDTDDEDDEDDEEAPVRTVAVQAPPASWGYVVPITMFFCSGSMLVVGLMSFELLHSMWGYRQNYAPTASIVQGLSNMFGNESGPKK